MDSGLDGVSLPVLDGSNYQRWKMRMERILEVKELDGVVYGAETELSNQELLLKGEGQPQAGEQSTAGSQFNEAIKSAENKLKELRTKEKRARMILTMAVDDKHTLLIVPCTTARQIWKRLELEYADKNPISEEALLSEYYSSKMDSSKTISDYISHLEGVVSKLAACGRIQTDQSVMAKIISGLPAEYAGLRRAWDMIPASFKSKELLISNLRKEEKILKESGAVSEALIARGSSNNHHGNNRSKKSRKESAQDRKKKSRCGYCKQIGHWWRECPTRPPDEEPVKKDRGYKGQQSTTGRSERALCAGFGDKDDTFTWYLDSGASAHMTGHRDWLDDYQVLTDKHPVKVGNGEYLYAIGKGSIGVVSFVGNKEHQLRFKNVYHVPKISDNLFSIGAADDLGAEINFKKGQVKISDDQEIIVTGVKLREKLYKLNVKHPMRANIIRSERTLEEWHSVLGHADVRKIESMAKNGCVDGMKIVEKPNRPEESCTACQQGKGKCTSHPSSGRQRAEEVLERVHMDLVGPIQPASLNGSAYFLLIKDEFSSYMFVDFLTTKAHVRHCVKRFIDDVSILTQSRVKYIRSDNGSEFRNQGMKILCDQQGIIQEYSAPYTPQQNGEAERANRTVLDAARSILAESSLPLSLWEEAIGTAVYVRNRTLNTRSNGKTPFELFYGRKPDLSHLMRFGQEVHIIDHKSERLHMSKMGSKTSEAYMVGYGRRPNTYRCLMRNTKDIVTTSDVVPAAHKPGIREEPQPTRSWVTFLVDSPASRANVDSDPPAPASPAQPSNNIDLPETSVEDGRRQVNMSQTEFAPEFDETYQPPTPQRKESLQQQGNRQDEQLANPSANLTFDVYPDLSQMREPEPPQFSRRTLNFPEIAPRMTQQHVITSQAGVSNKQQPGAQNNQQQVQKVPKATGQKRVTTVPQSPGKPTRTRSDLTGEQTTLDSSPTIIERLAPVLGLATGRSKRQNVKSTFMRQLSAIIVDKEPSSYQEALSSNDNKKWKDAIDDELAAHERNKTWQIVPIKPHQNEISAKWIFKIKDDDDKGTVRYKARLVARGFTQEAGVDFNEIFSPVVRMESIRLLFALSAQLDLVYAQFDITTAFLNGTVEEELYLTPPEGLNVPNGHTCRLLKSLYGLKQAPRAWNSKLVDTLQQYGFKPTYADPCVFVATEPKLIYLAIYVDDGLVFAREKTTIDQFMRYLSSQFEVKVLPATCFLGLQIQQDKTNGSILLHQSRYVERVLQRYKMVDCKGAATPIELNHQLNHSDTLECPPVDDIPYAEALGSLMYCAMGTRPDIAYALSVLSKHTSAPREAHWKAIKRVLRYLKGTSNQGLLYSKVDKLSICCYTDADWAGDHENRRSMSGMIMLINTGPICYRAQQQPIVALSTTEAEYISAAMGVQELLWLQRFMAELKVNVEGRTWLLCDNQSSMKLIKNPEFHKRTKHIDARYHFIRERYADKCFQVQYVSTNEQLADIFTKSLSSEKHHLLAKAIGCFTSKRLE